MLNGFPPTAYLQLRVFTDSATALPSYHVRSGLKRYRKPCAFWFEAVQETFDDKDHRKT
jgi:hypothetical protein